MATLSVEPYVFERETSTILSSSDWRTGIQHRRYRDSREKRSYRLRYPRATEGEVRQIRKLWTDTKGGSDRVTWTPPDVGSAVQFEFSDEPTWNQVGRNVYAMEFGLTELLSTDT